MTRSVRIGDVAPGDRISFGLVWRTVKRVEHCSGVIRLEFTDQTGTGDLRPDDEYLIP